MAATASCNTSDVEVIARARDYLNKLKRRQNINVFAANELHHCSPRCSFVEFKDPITQQLVFVCQKSMKVHFCGCRCEESFLPPKSEGYVCRLTGFVVADPPSVSYVRKSRDAYSKNRFVGDTYVRMGSGVSKQKRSQTLTITPFTSTLKLILTGKHRESMYAASKKKYLKEVCNLVGKRKGIPQSLQLVSMSIRDTYQKNRPHLNMPTTSTDARMETLGRQIFAYFKKFSSLKKTPRSIQTFVCVCVSKLRDGFSVCGVPIFKQNELCFKHAPSDIQFGSLPGIHCRHISILWRQMLSEVLSEKTNTPKSAMIFPD